MLVRHDPARAYVPFQRATLYDVLLDAYVAVAATTPRRLL